MLECGVLHLSLVDLIDRSSAKLTMATQARIVRVLGTLEYPDIEGLNSLDEGQNLVQQPQELAKIVSWIEDRKVRGCAIEDRAPLRAPGPEWEKAFLDYLSKIDCPYDLTTGTQGGAGGSPAVLRGLSWLVGKAVACEFEDRGTEYNSAARELLAAAPSSSTEGPSAMAVDRERDTSTLSPDFLTALRNACQALGVETPENFPPLPPASSSKSSTTPMPTATSQGIATASDSPVVRALEALLQAAQDRVLARDSAGTPETDGGEGGDELVGFAAGVCSGDEAIDRVATVLRMLFLLDLRGVQDEVNVILALAQSSRTS